MQGKWYHNFGKRLFDLFLVIPSLVLSAPVLALIAILVRIKLGAPIFFRQQRPGLHGRPFIILKFRTMANTRDAQGRLLPDVERLTPFGRLLRRTSLDELPELINVLTGDMSLVWPRPLLVRYLDRYTPEQFHRHNIRPGITGWAQINGRNELDWDDRFKLDLWYIHNLSLWLDIKILAMTTWKILASEGVLEEAGGAFPEFWGAQGPPPDGPQAFPADERERLVTSRETVQL